MSRGATQPTHRDDVGELKIPPNSSQAEQAVLGCLLYDAGCWDAVGGQISVGDFYDRGHGLVFAAVEKLITKCAAVDVVTVFVELEKIGEDEAVGGLVYLNTLAQGVAGSHRAADYAAIVRDRSILRQTISVGTSIAERAYSPRGESATKVLDEAERLVLGIAERSARGASDFFAMPALMGTLIDRVQAMADNPGELLGLPTGFDDLDRLTGGLQKSDLIILAARPSMGKTALALNIATHAAMFGGGAVAFFSMEMNAAQLAVRVVGAVGRIDQMRLRTGMLRDEEWPRLTEAIDSLKGVPLEVCEQSAMRVSDVRSAARRLARKHGRLGLVVVDYLQLMSGDGDSRDETRANEMGAVSRGLKALAKELNCPVLALSQLNRSVESRTDKRPMMSDLRDSGAIEQDADVIAFIYRDDYYDKASREPGVAEVIVSKARNGPTGTIKLAFLKPITRFETLGAMP